MFPSSFQGVGKTSVCENGPFAESISVCMYVCDGVHTGAVSRDSSYNPRISYKSIIHTGVGS